MKPIWFAVTSSQGHKQIVSVKPLTLGFNSSVIENSTNAKGKPANIWNTVEPSLK